MSGFAIAGFDFASCPALAGMTVTIFYFEDNKMALIKCKDCSKEVSATAYACPHCGAMLKTESLSFRLLILIIIAIVITFLFFRFFEFVVFDWIDIKSIF